MLSKNQIKLISSLKQKKYRLQHNLFVVEGVKTINELIVSKFNLHQLFTIESFKIDANLETIITEAELKKISFLSTPNKALALFKIPESKQIQFNQLIVALDNVRDPGNLGTIIRLCDWFGIKDLVCNIETVDCYNPKVIQATMGSISRVNITYLDLKGFIKDANTRSFGTFMDGENVYKMKLPSEGILILGNEANGISKDIEKLVSKKIAIPRFGNVQATESLNVATATAILLSEFRRS
ncbi:TrmH family RNA methyltransferase [Xanthomarina spongicola]|uniref:TrmH family RNA methyltransferase n=1 Tax=Xanthomarina spongicola TaxID=570520 RepID=A0A316DNN2_9FLAO|nr:RNA methyltransferase [Xanthomarina spongicola]PWK19148.1 TrmH family RNA methyltransferase [Xanthomarina spongicola]